MTAWDIKPGGVGGVLRRAGESAERMVKAGGEMQKTLPSAAASAGTIAEGGHEGDGRPGQGGKQGPVASALGVFARRWNDDLEYISRRAASSLLGAHLATKEYVEGDLKMAASRNRDAINGIVPDMPGANGGGGDGKR
ncbi:DUF6507 family protein [Streptomyces sp. AN091965]|uniref:DUF6507 family protein n=1 Tax=Streptomyces sp. AN091965 TaxID=2927803 RepID=UPI001F60B047|nr:DUF6507 family protein [Streptomyces sp. AN091965]MCI3932787.1 DUF6507 family protein [Streptomyces sp. AN091965]